MKGKIIYIHRLGYLTFSGYSSYIQKVEKNKEVYYNRIEEVKKATLPNHCGKKVDILV